ncbi:MAG: hypothetical protein M1837_005162 [Sclerophora amabilis]|nr:MAG: hypothetical protein M1837_005162 [Sclerophora amabilis]
MPQSNEGGKSKIVYVDTVSNRLDESFWQAEASFGENPGGVQMGEDDYAVAGGSLKLKGVKESKVEKKRKKRKAKTPGAGNESITDQVISPEAEKDGADEDAVHSESKDGTNKAEDLQAGKTESERRHEEKKRRRLNERLKREGVKTHKERVEELNKYLSNLSEHHDMPRIGPG